MSSDDGSDDECDGEEEWCEDLDPREVSETTKSFVSLGSTLTFSGRVLGEIHLHLHCAFVSFGIVSLILFVRTS